MSSGNGIFETINFKIFGGGECPKISLSLERLPHSRRTPYTGYTLRMRTPKNLTLRPWIVGVKDFINGYRHAYVDALSEVVVNKLFQHLSVTVLNI